MAILNTRWLVYIYGFAFFTMVIYATKGSAYSWYSTIDEFRNLTRLEKSLIKDLMFEKTLTNFTIGIVLAEIAVVKDFRSYLKISDIQRTAGGFPVDQHNELFYQLSYLQRDIALTDSRRREIRHIMEAFPSVRDYESVAEVLLNLQNTYFLNTKDLANGVISTSETAAPLSARACFRMAMVACKQNSRYDNAYKLCHEWCEEAQNRLHNRDATYSQDEIAEVVKRGNNMRWYYELCAASTNQRYVENSTRPELKCFLWDNNRHPWLILKPVRAELLSVNPTIVMFYNVLSDKKIAYVKDKASSIIRKSATSHTENTITVDSVRVSHNCWFYQSKDRVAKTLKTLVEIITGLPAVKFGEALQVANYGVGGHYKPHWDADTHHTNLSLNLYRRATFMYYLSDVEIGGATVFPRLQVAIKPVKGAAVFWHNLDRHKGMLDIRTLHTACPIVLGNKWVANIWIRETGTTSPVEHKYDV